MKNIEEILSYSELKAMLRAAREYHAVTSQLEKKPDVRFFEQFEIWHEDKLYKVGVEMINPPEGRIKMARAIADEAVWAYANNKDKFLNQFSDWYRNLVPRGSLSISTQQTKPNNNDNTNTNPL